MLHELCWGVNLRGPPITPETQLPLAHKMKKDKGTDLFSYQLYFKQVCIQSKDESLYTNKQ